MVSNNRISQISFGTSFTSGIKNTGRKIYNAIPNFKPIAGDNMIGWIEKFGRKCSSAEQRLILGATAIVMQPAIDAHNKSVDEKTRKVSVARTIGKVIAGTLTGFLIRKGCIKAMDLKMFKPSNAAKVSKDAYDQYKNAMGTIVALVVMSFTNFIIDAPLTKFITNLLIEDDGSGGKK